jgi:probable rRNA maturation factor
MGVVFVGRAKMRRLNAAYHAENRVTDVLSFPASPTFVVPKFYGQRYVGEIVVCRSCIPSYGALAHVLIHGTLHLLGYEHEKSTTDTALMHRLEEKIMQKLGIEFGK